jgi:hypothetical protein
MANPFFFPFQQFHHGIEGQQQEQEADLEVGDFEEGGEAEIFREEEGEVGEVGEVGGEEEEEEEGDQQNQRRRRRVGDQVATNINRPCIVCHRLPTLKSCPVCDNPFCESCFPLTTCCNFVSPVTSLSPRKSHRRTPQSSPSSSKT